MTRKALRIGIVVGLLVALLLGAAGYVYFIGTRTVLEHAEALSLSRMQAARLADGNTLRLFFASNRVSDPVAGLESEVKAPDARFSSRRQPELTLGSFDIAVEPTLGLGMLINASDWLINEEIQLHDVQSLSRPAFVGELREQVLASSYRSLLVVVHGYRETFPSALRKTAF
jgi:esterase/lipase superfamily enzyme